MARLIKKGSKGKAVKKLQNNLKIIGYNITADGVFGPKTEEIVKQFQEFAKIEVDGLVGSETQSYISYNIPTEKINELDAFFEDISEFKLSKEAIDMIVFFEIGGEEYYNKKLKSPTWPGYLSGITIGIGYDLGYKKLNDFKSDWSPFFNDRDLKILSRAVSVKGNASKRFVPGFRSFSVSYEDAYSVFENVTLKKWINLLHLKFPNSDKLDKDVQGALISLIFNRGTSVVGHRRRHMLAIKKAILVGNVKEIANQIEKSIIIWKGTSVEKGLTKRRKAEAKMVRDTI